MFKMTTYKDFKIAKNRGFNSNYKQLKMQEFNGYYEDYNDFPDIFNEVTSLQELNINKLKGGNKIMGNFKDEAKDYKPTTMKNISDLKEVDVENVVITETKIRDDGTSYVVKYIVVNGEEFRVPNSVISALKEMLEEKPKMKTFRVKRTGTTKEDTRYTLIPLD